MRVLKLNNIDDIQRETGESVIHRVRVVGYNTVPRYRLLNDLNIELSSGERIIIPKSFQWDLSSIPRFLWAVMPTDSDGEIASVIHDFLYINKPYGRGERARWFADLEMYKWSVVTNGTRKRVVVKIWKWRLFSFVFPSIRNIDNIVRYLGVVGFGWWTWYKVGGKIKNIFKKK